MFTSPQKYNFMLLTNYHIYAKIRAMNISNQGGFRMKKLVLDPQKLPISFIMGDKAYNGMPEGCTIERNGTRITYTSVIDNIEVRAECVAYDDFDASEWTVYFTNKGTEKSPIFRAINVINTVFEGENHKIYTGNGDYNSPDGYAEAETVLSYGYVFK